MSPDNLPSYEKPYILPIILMQCADKAISSALVNIAQSIDLHLLSVNHILLTP